MVKEGKTELALLCRSSNYVYDDEMVNSILQNETQADQRLNKSPRNVLRYPAVRSGVFKLVIAYLSNNMLYYGIILGGIPGGLLLNNCILGLLSVIAAPILNLFLNGQYAYRRVLLACMYCICGSLVVIMGALSEYEGR